MAKITKKMFKKALEGSLGTQRDLSERLNVTDSGISQYLDRNPDMRELLDKQRLKNIDRAEHEIFEQLDFNDDDKAGINAKIRQGASQFILKTIGKSKGWVEKQEIEHSGEQKDYTFNLIVKSAEEIKRDKLNNQPKAA